MKSFREFKQSRPERPAVKPTPVGVGGWLAVLCLVMAVAVPVTFGNTAKLAMELLGAVKAGPASAPELVVNAAVLCWVKAGSNVALAIGSLAAAVALYLRKPYAVGLAKGWWLVMPFGAAVEMMLGDMLSFPGWDMKAVQREVLIDLSRQAIAAMAALLYLRRSRRVAATFP